MAADGQDLPALREVAGQRVRGGARAVGVRDALTAAVHADSFRVREKHLCRAYTLAAERHNALGLTGSLDPTPRGYYDRPFLVIDAGRFATALRAGVTDPEVRRLSIVGTIDQFVDSTDVLSHAGRARAATWSQQDRHNFPETVASGPL